mmetsp:Transcript_114669/g.335295  ORF Transcript_114669/g.335295 Transcript_114669/m.335295 type:complete len:263 (-) Transcript_114669:1028-1816(-)
MLDASSSHLAYSSSCSASSSCVRSCSSMTFSASPPCRSISACTSSSPASTFSICCSTLRKAFCAFRCSLRSACDRTLVTGAACAASSAGAATAAAAGCSVASACLSYSRSSAWEPDQRRGEPPSLGKTRRVSQTPSSSERSWLTRITVPGHGCSSLSRASTVTASKSLVGSSNSNTLGPCESTRRSCSRRTSPPESMETCVCQRSSAKFTDFSRDAVARSRVMPLISGRKESSASKASSAISATALMTFCLGSAQRGGSCER